MQNAPTTVPIPSRVPSRLLASVGLAVMAMLLSVLPAVAVDGDPPPATDFQRVPLVTEVTQPMQLTVADDGRVFFIERTGGVRIHKPDGTVVTAGAVEVDTRGESGLQGIDLDPEFETNGWIYLYYSSIASQSKLLSRFHVEGDTIDLDSEVVMFEVPTTFPPRPSHVGGSIEFDADGNLWLSTGDDTQPYESNGYTPIDERPGRDEFDAQRTSGNTNDLRGKILRITPTDTEDGGYTIPDGNLFAPGTADTRPEIYAMGMRNPFRMTVDPVTGVVLVGDYGPDSRSANPERGPDGYVEWQTIAEPGNYGWPYCHGPNLPYVDYDFETGESGDTFDCDNPVNDSPNNTGLTELPPVIAPDVTYSKSEVDENFPEFGTGGAPHAGPIYHFDESLDSDVKFPEYYDGHAFFYEWGSNIMAAVEMAEGAPVRAEAFLPDMDFRSPMDMEFGPDGAMYLLEWGNGFGRNNPDDGLYRVQYGVQGARSPIARAAASPADGPTPLTVSFSSEGSLDPDEGQTISFAWDFGDGGTSTDANPTHTYAEPGDYVASLTVTDDTGRTGRASVAVTVGNTSPVVEITTPPNGGFVALGDTVAYEVAVTDAEDGEIDCDEVIVQPAIGHDAHAHPLEELPGCSGSFTTSEEGHGADANFFYVLSATYVDHGSDDASPLTGTDAVLLQPTHRQAEHYSDESGTSESRSDAFAEGAYRVAGIGTGDWIAFDPMNLSGIDAISYRLAASGEGAIEVRANSPDGPLIARTEVTPTGGTNSYADTQPAPVEDPGGTNTLYFVFETSQDNAFNIDAIDFLGTGVAVPPDTADQVITVTVPEPTLGGDFVWSIAGNGSVDLGDMANLGSYLQATGPIDPLLVTDTRTGGPQWSISGQVSDFEPDGPAGAHLGWTPTVIEPGAGATAGPVVASGIDGGDGLSVSSTLASAQDGHALGTGLVGADLDLRFPVTTASGGYTATLTITALS